MEPPFLVSKSLDVESIKKLSQKDVVVINRRCKDLQGRENYLSISSVKIREKKEKVMDVFKDNYKIKQALTDVKYARTVKKYSEKEYDVEYEIAIKMFAGIKISVRYISRVILGDNYIFSYIIEGKNKGSWRVIEFFEDDNNSTIVSLSMCEYIRVAPIANEIFAANPHYELGIITSTGAITLTQMKKFIEDNSR